MIESKKEWVSKSLRFTRTFIVIIAILILIPLITLHTQSEQNLVLGLVTFLVMFSLPLLFIIIPKVYSGIQNMITWTRNTPADQVGSILSTIVYLGFSIALFFQVLIFKSYIDFFQHS